MILNIHRIYYTRIIYWKQKSYNTTLFRNEKYNYLVFITQYFIGAYLYTH